MSLLDIYKYKPKYDKEKKIKSIIEIEIMKSGNEITSLDRQIERHVKMIECLRERKRNIVRGVELLENKLI